MVDQVEEDLSDFLLKKISLAAINETDAAIGSTDKRVMRYRIVNNEIYVSSRGKIDSEPCVRLINALDTLRHLKKLPNLDFIVNHEDGTDEPFYLTKGPQAPIFGWAKLKTTPHLILIPDYRSVSTLWFDDIRKCVEGKNFLGEDFPWESKKEMAFWRGVLTDVVHRVTICKQSKELPEMIDAGLTGFFLEAGEDLISYTKEHASYEEHMQYKYLPVLDGIMCTYPGYQWRLLSGCLPLKQESDQIQWFYRALKPNKHYLPIANNLSDLPEKICFARENDLACREVTRAGTDFVKNNLMFDDVYVYLNLALERYAACLDESVRKDLKKTSKDSNWTKISVP